MSNMRGVRGELHPNRKLTSQQVKQIFIRANANEKQESLAVEFRINQRTVSAIKLGKRWRCLNLNEKKEITP